MLLLNRNEKKWLRKKVQFLEQSGDTHILHVCLVRSTSPPLRRLQAIHAEKRKQQLLLLRTVIVLMRFFAFSLGAQNQVVFREFQQQSALASTKRV